MRQVTLRFSLVLLLLGLSLQCGGLFEVSLCLKALPGAHLVHLIASETTESRLDCGLGLDSMSVSLVRLAVVPPTLSI